LFFRLFINIIVAEEKGLNINQGYRQVMQNANTANISRKNSGKSHRPDWDEYFMNITREVAKRSTCMSMKSGAVIVKDSKIMSTGYSGAPRNTLDCYERGECLRRKLGIPSGQRYELCRSVHSEMNAIINAGRTGEHLVGSDLYLWGMKVHNNENKLIDIHPCFICKKMIINAGIKRVIAMCADGKIKKYSVEDWAREWRGKDMLDDMNVYSAGKYEEAKKAGAKK
jgi:dCMP deaminase